jgi:hypothetical protein
MFVDRAGMTPFFENEEQAMRDPHKIIGQLSPADALAVLKILTRDDEQLAARVAEIATARLSAVDPGEVALELYEELEFLKVEEVWDRAGPSSRHGYVEPAQAAEQMIDEVIAPYLEELKKLQALGMNAQANGTCMGLLLGLYKFERESRSEFKDWASDAPGAFAWAVVDAWKAGSPGKADVAAVKEFIEDELFGWNAGLV